MKAKVLKAFRYLLCFVGVVAVMFFGSQKNYEGAGAKPIISAINDTSFVVTADQLSESYIVADVANIVDLPSVLSINENYTSIAMKYEVTGAVGGNSVISKPNLIDTSSLTRGIIKYAVKAGDTLKSIAEAHGVTETQIRWSNNMKTGAVSVGQTLYIPSVGGILYTVKKGDTAAALASKYSSNVEEIVIYNDLETAEQLTVGVTIILPNGTLPEKERPEYVAPIVRPTPRPGYSGYVRDSGARQGMTLIQNYNYWRNMYYSTRWQNNPGAFGNCTWFVWYMRYNMGANYRLPSGTIGNAGTWTYAAWSNAFVKNKTPAKGAVAQTSTGSPGHVAFVMDAVPGSYIIIQEMNYAGYAGKYNIVYQSKINWADALKYNYIHGRK